MAASGPKSDNKAASLQSRKCGQHCKGEARRLRVRGLVFSEYSAGGPTQRYWPSKAEKSGRPIRRGQPFVGSSLTSTYSWRSLTRMAVVRPVPHTPMGEAGTRTVRKRFFVPQA